MNYSSIYLVVAIALLSTILASPQAFAQKKRKNDLQKGVSGKTKEREAEFYFTEGEKYFILEDYAKALLYYQKTLEVDENNPTAHYKIAEVLSKENKQDDLLKAAARIQAALRLEKKNKYFYLLGVTIYNNLAQFDKSAELYETMIKEVPGTEKYLFDLAGVYLYQNKKDQAIKTYERAEKRFGINDISSIQKMKLLLEEGKTEDAVKEGYRLIEAYPFEEKFVMSFAEVLSQHKMTNDAIALLEKFIADNDDAVNTKFLLAGMYRDIGQEEKSRTFLWEVFSDPAIQKESKVMVLSAYNNELNQAKIAGEKGDKEKATFAKKLFLKLKDEYPELSQIHVLGGDLFLASGENEKAIQEYQLAIQEEDVNYEVWKNLLLLEIEQKAYKKALEHSNDALELFPNQAQLYYFNGLALLKLNQNQEAVDPLLQAKKLSTNNPTLLIEISATLGEAYYHLKLYDKSDKILDEILSINPRHYKTLNQFSFYLAQRKDKLERAEEMSTLLIKENPNNLAYRDTFAWVLYAKKKYKEARKMIETVIESEDANAIQFEHYGDILFQLGDINGAVVQWKKAKEINPNNEILDKKIVNRQIYE